MTYVYQYMDAAQLIFRYDNTGHHKGLNLASFPHHKHEGSEANVLTSDIPDLVAVLDEINHLVKLP